MSWNGSYASSFEKDLLALRPEIRPKAGRSSEGRRSIERAIFTLRCPSGSPARGSEPERISFVGHGKGIELKAKAMATRKKKGNPEGFGGQGVPLADYRHPEATRKNHPPAKIAAEGHVPLLPKAEYTYSQRRPWAFHVCRNPQLLDKEMEYLARAQSVRSGLDRTFRGEP